MIQGSILPFLVCRFGHPALREALDHRAPFETRPPGAPQGEAFETPAVAGSSSFETRPAGAPHPSRRALRALLRMRRHCVWHSQSILTLRSGPKDRVSKGHPEERCAAPRLEGVGAGSAATATSARAHSPRRCGTHRAVLLSAAR